MGSKAPQTSAFLGRHPSTKNFWGRHLGTASDGQKTRAAPSIFIRFIALFYTHFTQGLHITLPYVLASYMVRDFGRQGKVQATSEQSVGRLIGFLGAAFCATQFITSFPIGRLSDTIGRKPILVVGNLSCIFSALAFGMADSYTAAILSRALGGLFNGIIGAEKAMIGEALTSVEQGLAFSYISIAWGLGALMGPMVGGVFSTPCAGMLRSTAACAQDSLLQRRPFLLPCLLAAGLSVVATLLTIFWLEETLPKLCRGSSSEASRQGGAGRDATERKEDAAGEQESLLGEGPGGDVEGLARAEGAAAAVGASEGGLWEVELGTLPAENGQQVAGGNSSKEAAQRLQGSHTGQGPVGPEGAAVEGRFHADPGDEELALLASSGREGAGAGKGGAAPSSERPEGGAAAGPPLWYKHKPVLLTLGGYSLVAFFYNYGDEVLPIFASAPIQEGGLGFTASQLAPSLSFSGSVLMLWSLLGFPRLLRRYGAKRVVRLGLWSTPVFSVVIPLASLVAGHRVPAQLIMFLGMGVRGLASTTAFTACIILVNLAAPQGSLGAVNGAGQSLASFVRTVAPALGGVTWGWSTTLGIPGHQFLPFLFIMAVALSTLLVYRALELPEAEAPQPAAASPGDKP